MVNLILQELNQTSNFFKLPTTNNKLQTLQTTPKPLLFTLGIMPTLNFKP